MRNYEIAQHWRASGIRKKWTTSTDVLSDVELAKITDVLFEERTLNCAFIANWFFTRLEMETVKNEIK